MFLQLLQYNYLWAELLRERTGPAPITHRMTQIIGLTLSDTKSRSLGKIFDVIEVAMAT